MARVTVVNDSDEFLGVMSDVLTEDGHVSHALKGADHSIDDIAATNPDLLIVDLRLGPESQVDGWSVIVAARAHDGLKDVPIILCSADLEALRRRADEIAAYADVHTLEKPFTLAQVEQLVSLLLDRAPA